jgi:hypothetical protein
MSKKGPKKPFFVFREWYNKSTIINPKEGFR